MTAKKTYSIGEFVNAVFARTSHASSVRDVQLIVYALEDLFLIADAEQSFEQLQGRFTSTDAVGEDGKLTSFARALVHIGGSEGVVSYRRIHIPLAPQADAPVFRWKNGAKAQFREVLDQLVDQTDTAFVTDVRLRELFSSDLMVKMMREHAADVPEEYLPTVEESCRQAMLRYRAQSQACWYVRAAKERAWLVERYIEMLRRGPIANSALPQVPEWELVHRRVGVMLSFLLYYFVGLISDGHASEPLAQEIAEVLRHFPKHPVLGVTKKETNEWSILVS